MRRPAPSNLSSVGFPAETALDIAEFGRYICESADCEAIPALRGSYLRWTSKCGAEFWHHLDESGRMVGVAPHFNAGSAITLVTLRDRTDNSDDLPVTWHEVAFPQLDPCLLVTAWSRHEGVACRSSDQRFGVACVARLLRTHHDMDHSHVAGEENSGVLMPAFMVNWAEVADEVIFHGEVISLETMDYYGAAIQLLDCRLDFGSRGQLHLPVYVPITGLCRPEVESARLGDFVCGVGCPQLVRLPDDEPLSA